MRLRNSKNEIVYNTYFQNSGHEENRITNLIEFHVFNVWGMTVLIDNDKTLCLRQGTTVFKFTRGKRFLKCVVRRTDYDECSEVKIKYKLIGDTWIVK